MDMRSKPIDTKSGKCLSCFGCRRRNISSKVTTIIVQVIVVTVIWFVIKKSCSSSNQGNALSSVMGKRSSDDQGVSICNQGEYETGSSPLQIGDLVSVSGSLEPDDQQKRFFLQVDVLIRNEDKDKPTLYTVGTPVVMDGLFKGDNSGGSLSDKDKAEFYYDNSLDEKDMDEFSNNSAEETKGENAELRLAVGKESIDTNALSNADGHQVAMVHGDQTFQNVNVNSQNEQANIEQQPRGIQALAVGIEQPGVQSQDFQQNQFGVPGVQNQNNQQIESGLQYQSQQIQTRDQYGSPEKHGMNSNNIQQGNQMSLQGNSNDAMMIQSGQLQENNMDRRVDSTGENNGNLNAMNSPTNNDGVPENNDMGVAGLNQGQGAIPPAEGFKDRLTRFKTEYYGRPVDALSDSTTTSYALNNPSLCEDLDKVDVLFLIHTIPQSDEQRQRIRETFAKASLFQPFSVAHVFVVGLTSSPNFQGNLDKDHKEYGDVVQGEFSDKPETRTLKGLMGFRWVTTFCAKARFVFKIDEDVFVDTEKLLHGLIPAVTNVVREKAMLCYFVQNAPVPRSGPNAFDHNVFPKSSRMRPYCKGFAILTTVSTLSSLVTASEHVPLFQFDDLYLYGILPFVAGGIEVYDLGNKRAFHDFGMAVVNCYKDLQDKCPYVATKAFSSRFTSLWEFVTARKAPESPQGFQGDPSLWNIASFQSTFYS